MWAESQEVLRPNLDYPSSASEKGGRGKVRKVEEGGCGGGGVWAAWYVRMWWDGIRRKGPSRPESPNRGPLNRKERARVFNPLSVTAQRCLANRACAVPRCMGPLTQRALQQDRRIIMPYNFRVSSSATQNPQLVFIWEPPGIMNRMFRRFISIRENTTLKP